MLFRSARKVRGYANPCSMLFSLHLAPLCRLPHTQPPPHPEIWDFPTLLSPLAMLAQVPPTCRLGNLCRLGLTIHHLCLGLTIHQSVVPGRKNSSCDPTILLCLLLLVACLLFSKLSNLLHHRSSLYRRKRRRWNLETYFVYNDIVM